ncbi:hypothetical protein KP509_15G056700 [Ceratopteris richardii]|uniref:HMA domain-containing protein n=1 Tax=Ceratopteris richardii TaxID=49495 RepID=A0A8T2T7C5_CERRI|nr:hypothetical protein KP509_15G056700 [Ceratopteris richardii]
MAPSEVTSYRLKAPAKEISLKVFIHCEGCKRKVKKFLYQVDGVEAVTVDAQLGKVTVTGLFDSKCVLEKIVEAGKVAEVIATKPLNNGRQGPQPKNPPKREKKVRFTEDVTGAGDNHNGNDEKMTESAKGRSNSSNNNHSNSGSTGSDRIGYGEDENKKKADNGGLDSPGPTKSTVHKSIATRMVETGYSVESADYATHFFSDENVNGCYIL